MGVDEGDGADGSGVGVGMVVGDGRVGGNEVGGGYAGRVNGYAGQDRFWTASSCPYAGIFQILQDVWKGGGCASA